MPVVNYDWDELEDNIVEEYDDAGNTLATYTTEPELHGNLISQNRGGVESQYHFDAQGSTLALTDANQQVTDTYAYTAFGERTERTGTTENPFQYIGQKQYRTDGVTGDIDVRRRPYRASIGRWQSYDPAWPLDGLNGYVYVSNRVGIFVDPSGRAGLTISPKGDNFGKLACGDGAKILWRFVLDVAAPCNGYLVQRVRYTCDITRCNNCPFASRGFKKGPGGILVPDFDVEYWEAWYVEEGDRISREGGEPIVDRLAAYTDGAQLDTVDDYCGLLHSWGQVKFFCEDKKHPAANGIGTGDLGRQGKVKEGSGWTIDAKYGKSEWGTGPCKAIETGAIPSTGNEPGFWSKPHIAGMALRHASVWWDCCPCKSNFVRAAGKPRVDQN